MKLLSRRTGASLAALVVTGLLLAGCSSTPTAGNVGTDDGIVKIQGSLIGTDAAQLEKSWAGWEAANHIKIEYSGSSNFEEQIATEAQQGNTPDLAIIAQPGLVDDLAKLGYLQKLPSAVQTTVTANFSSEWTSHTVVNGNNYAAPLLASLDGWVVYSPTRFTQLGLKVPQSWSDLLTLTEYLRSNDNSAPWCEGFDTDADSGSTGASMVADMVLREDGPTVYDKWVNHGIPFTDPAIQKAWTDVGEVLQNKTWVNAGSGGVKTINTTTPAQVAQALESGKCDLSYEPSSFFEQLDNKANGSATVGPASDLWAFILPSISDTSDPSMTVGGDFVSAFSNDSDTQKVQAYLASTAWAKKRMSLGGAISPDKHVLYYETPSQLQTESLSLIRLPKATIRFDAADLMPAVVGDGSFLSGMVDWINGKPTDSVLSTIDGSWPSN
jgi:alpha-glucoside transport system substrate-binding protein